MVRRICHTIFYPETFRLGINVVNINSLAVKNVTLNIGPNNQNYLGFLDLDFILPYTECLAIILTFLNRIRALLMNLSWLSLQIS